MSTDILTTHRQLAPFVDEAKIKQGIDDIHQCIANILSTIKGSDVLRPDFGSDHFQYIDYPEDIAVPNFVREITKALTVWEKRIIVESIAVSGVAPHFTFTVYWTLSDAVYREIYQTEVTQ